MPARWMLYSHDALGLGHARRTIAIARAVIASHPDLSTLLVTCSPLADALPMPRGLDYLKLPSACKTGPGKYSPRTLGVDRDRLRDLRAAALRETCAAFAPHLLLVDKSPLGLMGELTQSLAVLSGGETRRVVGWRDILDTPEAIEAEWRRQGTLRVLERNYHEVWVYGDPAVFDIREHYRMPDPIADRIHHVGYLAPPVKEEDRERFRASLGLNGSPLAVVTVGGGEGGECVLEAWFDAAERRLLPADLHTVVVTGPFMGEAAQRGFLARADTHTRVKTFVPGLEHLIAAADVVIGRAGYNTVCEALGLATPALLVPRVLHRGEQAIRAQRLAELGLAEVLDEPHLTPRALADTIARILARPRRERPPVKADGFAEVTRRVLALLPRDGAVQGTAATPPAELDNDPLAFTCAAEADRDPDESEVVLALLDQHARGSRSAL